MGKTESRHASGAGKRRFALCLTTILASGLAAPAFAQDAPPHQNTDANGVDLVTGGYKFTMTEGEIGSGVGKLEMIRYRNAPGPGDNWTGLLNKQTLGGVTHAWITFGDISEAFTYASGVYTSDKGDGATLVENTTALQFTFTAADGTKVVYKSPTLISGVPLTAVVDNAGMPFGGTCHVEISIACGVPVSVKRPNQLEATLTWTTPSYCAEPDEEGVVHCNVIYRLQDIRNSAGYAIKIKYKSDSPPFRWYGRDTLRLMDLSKVYCDPAAMNCDSVAGTPVSYTLPSGGVDQVTDWRGGTWRFSTAGGSYAVRRPGSSTDDITVSFSSGKVSSITKDGLTTGYSWSTSSGLNVVTMTTPSGSSSVVTSDPSIGQQIGVTNGTSNVVTNTYDSAGRLTRVTMPEGNYTNYTYDARGNVTEVRKVAKSGSGLSDIVKTASFPSTCTNELTCNKPDYTIDERGNRTDYTYDSTHGGVTRVQFAAPTGTTRPQEDLTYTSTYAKVKNSSGTLVDAATPTYLITQMTMCATAATCTDANETKVTYSYGSGSSIDNLQPLAVTIAAGDASVSATTTYTYDDSGQLLTADGPLSGSDDTTRYRYDSYGYLVGIVRPDPDGAGALKFRATRFTYSASGLLTTTEVGTVNSQSDSDWASMTVLQTMATTYDSDDLKIRDSMAAGGTTYSVIQYSYNSDKRLECTAVRMNAANFASLPTSACTLDTAGSYGADHITKYTYDADGRMTKTQTGYGVSGVQADEVTTTYTANGLAASVTDAEGNRTGYTYDGVDRLAATFYPSPTKGAGTSSTTDYEALAYNAAGSVTTRFLRGYASDSTKHIDYTYDNLGRMTVKDLPNSELDVAYTYDFLGRLTGASQTGNALTFTYDALGRNLTQVGPQGTVSSQFDAAGRRTRTTWPDSFYVSYDHLVTGETSVIRENGATSGVGVLATYAYDDLGRRTTLTLGNGTVSTYGYDTVSRLTSLGINLDGSTTTNDVTTSFGYSPANQIASQTRTNDLYAWDGHTNVARSYTSNGLNQLTAAGATSLGYDARGDLTSSGSNSYGYSSENLLTSATVSSVSLTFAYDPMLRLYQEAGTTTARFIYDGTDMIGEANSSNVLQKRYVFGPGTDEPLVEYAGSGTGSGVRTFLQADERGSIVARSNESGAKTAINSYDEYGIPFGSNVGRFQYTGQAWLSQLGMSYYKARMYSPALGRFMQTDLIGYDDGMNMYAYVKNDPVNRLDPFGLDEFCWTVRTSGMDKGGFYVSSRTECANFDSGGGRNGPISVTITGGGGGNIPATPIPPPPVVRCVNGNKLRSFPVPDGYKSFADNTGRSITKVGDPSHKVYQNPSYQAWFSKQHTDYEGVALDLGEIGVGSLGGSILGMVERAGSAVLSLVGVGIATEKDQRRPNPDCGGG
jgi:RHS repeat-associated protein